MDAPNETAGVESVSTPPPAGYLVGLEDWDPETRVYFDSEKAALAAARILRDRGNVKVWTLRETHHFSKRG